ncbi:MAG: glycosyltransferase [Lachnospiraceae bacterium]|nr:glycosyltransferase [Lachnospiraceae bacterium]
MRILMIVTWYSPKDAEVMTAGVFHYEQSMALKKYADMALYYPYDTDMTGRLSKKTEHDLLTYRYGASGSNPISKFSDLLNASKKVIRDFKPDIIHAHVAQGAGRLALALSKACNIPYIVTEHSPMEQNHLDNTVTRMMTFPVYKFSKANICVSKDSMTRLKEYFPNCKFHVIYNGIINPSTIDDDGNKYRVEGYTNALITAAFYDKFVKGYQYLLPAIKELKNEGIKIKLHICGGGDYFDYYKQMADELEISDSVIFYGQCKREQVYSIMRQVDFSISASEYECSGVSVQEALFLKNPMLVTRSGGANSLVTPENAIVVDRKSIPALVEGIKEMINKLDTFDKEKIEKYAFYNFEIDNVSKRYKKLYERILKK